MVSPTAGGGRSPADVRAIAAMLCADERRLLVQAQRKGEVEELRESARASSRGAGLLQNSRGGGANERGGSELRVVAGENEVWAAVPGDRVQVDGRDDAIHVGRVLREIRRSEASERPSVRGQEQDRVIRLGRPRRGLGRRVRARQLEERCGSGAVVVRAWARAAVVAVCEHDDDLVRPPFAEREQVLELHAAAAGDFRVKTLALGAQAVLRKPLGDPGCGLSRADRAGSAVGVRVHERAIREDGGGAVEVRLQRRSAERLRVRDGERRDQKRNPDEEPCAPVHPAVHRPVERSWARPAPLPERRMGGHARQ